MATAYTHTVIVNQRDVHNRAMFVVYMNDLILLNDEQSFYWHKG